MDRDVYLILVGAGISLASSIVTLLFQFFLSSIKENIHRRRNLKIQKSNEVRAKLTQGIENSALEIDAALRMRKILSGGDSKKNPYSRLPKKAGQLVIEHSSPSIWGINKIKSGLKLSMAIGLIVFIVWLIWLVLSS